MREFLADYNRIQHFWEYQTNVDNNKDIDENDIGTRNNMMQVDSEREENPAAHQQEVVEVQPNPRTLESNQQQTPPTGHTDVSTQLSPETACFSHRDVGIQTPCWDFRDRRRRDSHPAGGFYFNTHHHALPSVSSGCPDYHGGPSPTRTMIKSLQGGRKSPFVSYGWNDLHKDIGSKRTFNINASEPEIYPAALHAFSRRKEMLRQARDTQNFRPTTAPNAHPVNHSSVWMTEYQDVFNRPKRPRSAPLQSKSVRWQSGP